LRQNAQKPATQPHRFPRLRLQFLRPLSITSLATPFSNKYEIIR
jgi:hypothetical protein